MNEPSGSVDHRRRDDVIVVDNVRDDYATSVDHTH